MSDLTAKMVRDRFSYCKDSGEIKWATHKRSNFIGMNAGSVNERGYLIIRLNGKNHKAHRIAWLYHYGELPKNGIDHINGNKLDNRISNMRDVGQLINNQNREGPSRNSTTGFLGVTYDKRKSRFVAQINYGSFHKYLGSFKTKEEASERYKKAKSELHPEARSIA